MHVQWDKENLSITVISSTFENTLHNKPTFYKIVQISQIKKNYTSIINKIILLI